VITDKAILMRNKMTGTLQVSIKDKADILNQQGDTVNQEDTVKFHPATAVAAMEVLEMNMK